MERIVFPKLKSAHPTQYRAFWQYYHFLRRYISLTSSISTSLEVLQWTNALFYTVLMFDSYQQPLRPVPLGTRMAVKEPIWRVQWRGLVGALKAEFFNCITFLCCVNFLGLQNASTTSLRAAVSPPTLVRRGCRSQWFSLVKPNSAP